MIGHIESYDDERQTGAIKFEDKFYEFHIDEWTPEIPPKVGDDVDFVPEEDGSATDVGLVGSYLDHIKPVKSRYIASFLGILFGWTGAHRLYLGFYAIGIVQLVILYFFGAVAAVWGLVEGILIFGGHIYKDAKGRPLK
jgi:hypothetical protein